MHTNLTSTNNETANNIMEGKVSASSSPEELLEQALQHLETGNQDQAIPLIRYQGDLVLSFQLANIPFAYSGS
jgi:hypothetical protein